MTNGLAVSTDSGFGDIKYVTEIEYINSVILPPAYVKFILQHNGASVLNEEFNYYDPDFCNGQNGKMVNNIYFHYVENIQHIIESSKSWQDEDWYNNYKLEDGLIPFGDNGGGDEICFDYRKDNTTDNPSIVIWYHELEIENSTVFIAKNFEKFVNMLHEPTDLDEESKQARRQAREKRKQKEEQLRKKYQEESARRIAQLRPRTTPLTTEEERLIKMSRELAKDLEYADKK